jgi:hypothetical protein
MVTKVSWLCLFLAVISLVWGGLRALTTEEDRDNNQGLIVEKMQYDLGEQSLGCHVLEVRVCNTGNRPHRIIGIPNG